MGLAVAELDRRGKQGEEPHDAVNNSAVHLIKAAQAYARYYIVDSYVRAVTEGNYSAPVKTVVAQLCELFLIYWLLERTGDFVLVSRR